MELTGKCKEEFEKWILNDDDSEEYRFGQNLSTNFEGLPSSFKYGVLVDYFDSIEMDIVIERRRNDLFLFVIYLHHQYGSGVIPNKQSRPEARTASIKKANELRNEALTNKL
jgi:hypothetical protein|tara:strand:+ start:1136 stop:1471 length:336 start_codon:yes stop_codon:yes gene_type:complete